MKNERNNVHEQTTGIIFISGAGLQPWIWLHVTETLSVPYAIADFSSLKQQKKLDTITLDDYVAEAAAKADGLHVDKIIVVAHSIGGVVGVELAKQLGERLTGFVSVCAAIPEPAKPFLSIFPFPQSIITRIILKLAGTKPPASAIVSGLCTDLDDTTTTRVVQSFSAEPIALYTTPLSGASLPKTPALYFVTTNDKEYPQPLQEAMATRLGARIINVDTGHLPMLSQPGIISEALQSFIKEV